MQQFGLMRAPRNLVFGVGQRLSLAGHARALGSRVLVVTDARLEAEPVFAELMANLAAAGLAVQVFSAVDPELPRSCVAAGVDSAAGFDPEVIVGIGGGSCMDAAKLIALLLAHGGDLADYYDAIRDHAFLWMADRLKAGVVWANTFNRFDPTSPFGGYKESGFGREGGRHGLEGYLDV